MQKKIISHLNMPSNPGHLIKITLAKKAASNLSFPRSVGVWSRDDQLPRFEDDPWMEISRHLGYRTSEVGSL